MGKLVNASNEMVSIENTAKRMVEQKLCPSGMDWQALAICGQRGRELGIDPVQAMQEIYVVQGRAMPKAELQLQLMYSNIEGFTHIITKWEEEEVEAIFYAKHLPKEGIKRKLTRKYADQAEWSTQPVKGKWVNAVGGKKGYFEKTGKTEVKDQWKKNPIGMLFNRLITEVARTQFPQYKTTFDVAIASREEADKAILNIYPNATIDTTTGEVHSNEESQEDEVIEGEFIEDEMIEDEIINENKKETVTEEPIEKKETKTEDQKQKCSVSGCDKVLTFKVYNWSVEKYGRPLCFDHQPKQEG